MKIGDVDYVEVNEDAAAGIPAQVKINNNCDYFQEITWAHVLRLCPGLDNIIDKHTYCKMYIVHALHCILYHKDQSSVN